MPNQNQSIELTSLFMMNQTNDSYDRIKIRLGIALLAALTGCVGYVDRGYYGGPVVVPGHSVYFWGVG
jgi:hypothetical protein